VARGPACCEGRGWTVELRKKVVTGYRRNPRFPGNVGTVENAVPTLPRIASTALVGVYGNYSNLHRQRQSRLLGQCRLLLRDDGHLSAESHAAALAAASRTPRNRMVSLTLSTSLQCSQSIHTYSIAYQPG
jgi:hypothetical protein